MAGMNVNSVMNAYQSQAEYGKAKTTQVKEKDIEKAYTKKASLGKTVGEPKLSEKAEKYYNQLKKKFGQYDFILVSSAEKENARANAGKYANNLKTVVLIDEEKIEKMATDEKFRKQYEGILSGATNQINQIKATAEKSGAALQGVVMQVNDNGTTSFFAALKKSSDAQRAMIEKKTALKRAEKKEAEKKEAKEARDERIEKSKAEKADEMSSNEAEAGQRTDGVSNESSVTGKGSDDIVVIMADSFEELIKKIEEYQFNERSNSVQTESEKLVGQNIDFRG